MSSLLSRCVRVLSLVLFAALGASALMYCAPGYFTASSELDASHAAAARSEVQALERTEATLPMLLRSELRAWSHGDLGVSRQYLVPVAGLLRSRAGRSVRLVLTSMLFGWLLALLLALPAGCARSRAPLDLAIAAATCFLLAVPIGAVATFCLVRDSGGPVLVLSLAIAVREFKLIFRVLRSVWESPHLLYARAAGLSTTHIVRSHIWRQIAPELLSMAVTSFTLALSSLVPVEVVFDYPGVGQLAWSAAMNRDLPVLVACTAVVAACTAVAGFLVQPSPSAKGMECV